MNIYFNNRLIQPVQPINNINYDKEKEQVIDKRENQEENKSFQQILEELINNDKSL